MAPEQRTGTAAEVAQLARPLEAPARRLRDLPEVSEAMIILARSASCSTASAIPVASACPSHDFQDGLVADGIAKRTRAMPTYPPTDEPLRPAEIVALPRRRMFAVWCTYSTADEHMERWLA